jgi:hypothetical protein
MLPTRLGTDHWGMTTTLHIEYDVTDFATWKGDFVRFAKMRQQAGVRQERIHQPIDGSSHVVLQLDFDDVDAAENYLDFLRTKVWAEPGNVPTLIGEPQTRLLHLSV